MKRREVFELSAAIAIMLMIVWGGCYVIWSSGETSKKNAREKCEKISYAAGSDQWKTGKSGECYFIKDNALQEIDT